MNLRKSDKPIIAFQYSFCGAHIVTGQPLYIFPIAALQEDRRNSAVVPALLVVVKLCE
jgi:hypothetical protein